MTRVIQTRRPFNERKKILIAIKLTLREFENNNNLNQKSRDQAAFISLALVTISTNVDSTVEPWEKRGYWVKADKFRNEWSWTRSLGMQLREAILREEWEEVTRINKKISEKLVDIRLPIRSQIGTIWEGSWQKLQQL